MFLYAALIAVASAHPIRPSVYEGAKKNGLWTPVHPKVNPFTNWTEGAIRGLMGLHLEDPVAVASDMKTYNKVKGVADLPSGLPKSWDSRQHFASCSQDIRDQAHCGSCWAFAAAETLSENLCIISGGSSNIKLSPQDLVSCDSVDHGCQGGTLPNAWNYLASHGIVSDDCLPYTAADGNVTSCHEGQCSSVSGTWQTHRCPKKNFLSTTEDIKNGVMQMGSAETGFYVYEDFMHYKSGVYKHDNVTGGQVLGGHAVRIVGWGVDAVAGEYWIVANSWGSSWGENGFFKIAFSDRLSGFALGGAFNCGDLKPAPPAPAPAPSPSSCKDILPTNECAENKAGDAKFCSNYGHLTCQSTCGCCVKFDKPAYCSKN